MGSTSYQEVTEQTFSVTIDNGLSSVQEKVSFSPLQREGRSQKELVISSLRSVLRKLEDEIAEGNLG